jgi:hypothetical protein
MKSISKRSLISWLMVVVLLFVFAYVVKAIREEGLNGEGVRDINDSLSKPIVGSAVSPGDVGGLDATGRIAPSIGESDGFVEEKKTKAIAGSTVTEARDQSSTFGNTGTAVLGMGNSISYNEKIVRTGSLEIKIKKDKFEFAYDNAVDIVTRAGGYISSSRSLTTDDKVAGGELLIRVPARNFDDVLKALKGLGKVKNQEITSEEVSLEYVDLQSRLRNWRAQEVVMLGLMKRAKTIPESISIQNNLQQIQMEIEQISGRLQYLDDRTSYSEIKLSINEPSIVPVKVDKDEFGLKAAVSEALEASSSVLATIIITIGYMMPIAIMVILMLPPYRLLRKRMVTEVR